MLLFCMSFDFQDFAYCVPLIALKNFNPRRSHWRF